MFDNHDDILTVDELMDILYIGKNTAYQLLNSRKIQAFKIGRVWKIPREAVTQYIIQQSGSKN
ncbi:helix-turn-helix domain-containing protein [Niallia nealsonii]|nr:helix-turn-helix domain-containing protein [Niallia nealsonii]